MKSIVLILLIVGSFTVNNTISLGSENNLKQIFDTPQMVSPTNGSFVVNGNITFQWEKVGLAFFYQIQVSEDKEFANPVVDNYTVDTSFNVSGLADRSYYWRVRGGDYTGIPWHWSEAWYFVVFTPLSPPILISPDNGAKLTDVTLKWQSLQGAIKYHVQVSESQTFQNPVISETLSSTSLTITSLDEGTYFWRVQGEDQYGNLGEWSEMRQFSVMGISSSTPVGSTENQGGINSVFLLMSLIFVAIIIRRKSHDFSQYY